MKVSPRDTFHIAIEQCRGRAVSTSCWPERFAGQWINCLLL